MFARPPLVAMSLIFILEGEDAFADRIAMEDCPYASGHLARPYWLKGWRDAAAAAAASGPVTTP